MALIEAVTVTRPSGRWYRLLEDAGVPCGVLNRIDQAVADEQVRARGFVVELPHSKAGTIKATGSPARLSRTPVRLTRAGPLLGEHTREILAGLGMGEVEIVDLIDTGVIRQAEVPRGSDAWRPPASRRPRCAHYCWARLV